VHDDSADGESLMHHSSATTTLPTSPIVSTRTNTGEIASKDAAASAKGEIEDKNENAPGDEVESEDESENEHEVNQPPSNTITGVVTATTTAPSHSLTCPPHHTPLSGVRSGGLGRLLGQSCLWAGAVSQEGYSDV